MYPVLLERFTRFREKNDEFPMIQYSENFEVWAFNNSPRLTGKHHFPGSLKYCQNHYMDSREGFSASACAGKDKDTTNCAGIERSVWVNCTDLGIPIVRRHRPPWVPTTVMAEFVIDELKKRWYSSTIPNRAVQDIAEGQSTIASLSSRDTNRLRMVTQVRDLRSDTSGEKVRLKEGLDLPIELLEGAGQANSPNSNGGPLVLFLRNCETLIKTIRGTDSDDAISNEGAGEEWIHQVCYLDLSLDEEKTQTNRLLENFPAAQGPSSGSSLEEGKSSNRRKTPGVPQIDLLELNNGRILAEVPRYQQTYSLNRLDDMTVKAALSEVLGGKPTSRCSKLGQIFARRLDPDWHVNEADKIQKWAAVHDNVQTVVAQGNSTTLSTSSTSTGHTTTSTHKSLSMFPNYAAPVSYEQTSTSLSAENINKSYLVKKHNSPSDLIQYAVLIKPYHPSEFLLDESTKLIRVKSARAHERFNIVDTRNDVTAVTAADIAEDDDESGSLNKAPSKAVPIVNERDLWEQYVIKLLN